jgi:hypothetical protein
MNDCPEPYKSNCRWLGIKCNECSAASSNKKALAYSPISPIFPIHPKQVEEKERRSKEKREEIKERKSLKSYKKGKSNYQRGRAEERRVIKDMGGHLTSGSGAICGDGDGVVKMGELSLSIEHKSRIGKQGRLSITKAEWEKGKRQGIDLYVISSEDQRIVLMDYELFIQIKETIDNG